jgi:small-conductance mechanosensitive channel/CRP-like cAMP-binding protein
VLDAAKAPRLAGSGEGRPIIGYSASRMRDRAWVAIMEGESSLLLAAAIVIGFLMTLLLRGKVAGPQRERLNAPVPLLLAAGLSAIVLHFSRLLSAHPVALMLPPLLLLLAYGRLFTVAIFDWMLMRRANREAPPRILRDIAEGVILVGALLVLLRAAGVESMSLLTTSALFTAILGLSLQDTLGNLLAGLVLQTQRPFEVGDWIQVDRDGLQLGRVIELNWRATKVLTSDQQELTVPNSLLARSIILNMSRPTSITRRTVELAVPYEYPTEHVRTLLERAMHGVAGIVEHPKPQVRTVAFVDHGVRYRVQFYVDDFGRRDEVESILRDRLWYALGRAQVQFARGAGIPINPDQPGIEARNLESRTRAIRRVAFLCDLPDEAIATLAADARTERYAPGELVVRQGEAGEELYLCLEGELLVLYTPETGEQREIARLAEGGMFGEFAQMTGEVRAASVQAVSACEVVAIGKPAFSAVLNGNPSFAELISHRLAERKAELDAAGRETSEAERRSVDQNKGDFLRRLRELFNF